MGFHSYGTTDVSHCPFCGKQALTKNKMGIAVCKEHIAVELPELKCMCKETLQMKEGKFGPFCICSKCGIISLKKALDSNNVNLSQFTPQKREIVVDAKNAHLFGLR